ncbi:MAG: 2-hydroxyacid dehydrogenase [Spirochaetaceae bacterium]|nr:MAG: 2-hydroxyacid dehydrogenase [Spirochaetaceae bacterium]
MTITVFSTKRWVRDALDEANGRHAYQIRYLEARLERETAALAEGSDAVCIFVNDNADRDTIEVLAERGVKMIALRCAGFNNVDLRAADDHGIIVARVPAYSPHAVAEHAVGLLLTLNRKLHRAYNRIREGNFALDGLMGFDLHGKTVGIVGTGTIGRIFAGIMRGFGTHVVAYDRYPNDELVASGVEYVSLKELYQRSDVISLHCPLTHETYHLINTYAISAMKRGVMIINTSRGALIDSLAVIEGLKNGRIGSVALDVYEEEADLFFEDLSGEVIQDDVFVRLLTFPNVLITAHQAFFTREAVGNIATTTLANIAEFVAKSECANCITAQNAYG